MAMAPASLCLGKSFQGPPDNQRTWCVLIPPPPQLGISSAVDPWTTGVWTAWVHLYVEFLCKKYSWRLYPQAPHPQIPPNYRSQTISSYPQLRIPNCSSKILFWIHGWLIHRMWRANFRIKHFIQIFIGVGLIAPTPPPPPPPTSFQGQLTFKTTAWISGINDITFQLCDSLVSLNSWEPQVPYLRNQNKDACCSLTLRAVLRFKSHLTCKVFWKPVNCAAKKNIIIYT